MCGRFVAPADAAIERAWQIGRRDGPPSRQRFNVTPTAEIPILVLGADGSLELHAARWGLVPAWWQRDKPPTATFNARLEDAAIKPMWRDAWRSARCLVPAEGWYEWQAGQLLDPATGELKPARQPFHVHRPGGGVFAFAGLWSRWRPAPDAPPQWSCAILTRAAAGGLVTLHERMPLVLRGAAERRWLDPQLRDPAAVRDLVTRHADAGFEFYPVSIRVNRPQYDDAGLIERLGPL